MEVALFRDGYEVLMQDGGSRTPTAVEPIGRAHTVCISRFGRGGRHIVMTVLEDMRSQSNGRHPVLRNDSPGYVSKNSEVVAGTSNERIALQTNYESGNTPWMAWRTDPASCALSLFSTTAL